MLGGYVLVHDAAERDRLREASGADAVDMESGALARSGRLAGVVRAISDDASSSIEGLDSTIHPDGRTNVAGPRALGRDATRRRRSYDSRRDARIESSRRGGGSVTGGRVLLAAPRSFCAGVDRAIEIVERLLEQHGAPVYVRHAIVHNDHVLRRLEGLGAVFVESRGRDPGGRDLRPLGARRRAGGEGERAGARPPRRRRDVPAREQGARRGAALRRQRPPRRARRPREPRRGDRHARRAARLDRRDRVAGAGARARHRQAGRRDHADDAVARRRRADRRRARGSPRHAAAAGRRRHLLRDAEPAGRRQGDGRPGRDARARDRLGDELERAAPRRGRAGGRRAGDAHRRRERARRRAHRRARDRRPHRGRVDAGGARPGHRGARSPRSATRCRRRSPSRRKTSTSGCRRRSRAA